VSMWAPSILFRGRVTFSLSAAILIENQTLFGGHMALWWLLSIYFGGQTAFLFIGAWHFVCHLENWWAPSDYFWWLRGVLVTSWHLVGHPAFNLMGTWPFGGYPVSLLVGLCGVLVGRERT